MTIVADPDECKEQALAGEHRDKIMYCKTF